MIEIMISLRMQNYMNNYGKERKKVLFGIRIVIAEKNYERNVFRSSSLGNLIAQITSHSIEYLKGWMCYNFKTLCCIFFMLDETYFIPRKEGK